MGKLTRTTLAIEEDLLERFDAWMAAHGYANRSQAMRDMVRSALTEEEWADPRAKVVAVLSVIYDHEARELAQELTHMQHQDHDVIMCSQHVHLDRRLCLEVILMQGRARQLRRVADHIIATRGVRAGKLTPMSTSV